MPALCLLSDDGQGMKEDGLALRRLPEMRELDGVDVHSDDGDGRVGGGEGDRVPSAAAEPVHHGPQRLRLGCEGVDAQSGGVLRCDLGMTFIMAISNDKL